MNAKLLLAAVLTVGGSVANAQNGPNGATTPGTLMDKLHSDMKASNWAEASLDLQRLAPMSSAMNQSDLVQLGRDQVIVYMSIRALTNQAAAQGGNNGAAQAGVAGNPNAPADPAAAQAVLDKLHTDIGSKDWASATADLQRVGPMQNSLNQAQLMQLGRDQAIVFMNIRGIQQGNPLVAGTPAGATDPSAAGGVPAAGAPGGVTATGVPAAGTAAPGVPGAPVMAPGAAGATAAGSPATPAPTPTPTPDASAAAAAGTPAAAPSAATPGAPATPATPTPDPTAAAAAAAAGTATPAAAAATGTPAPAPVAAATPGTPAAATPVAPTPTPAIAAVVSPDVAEQALIAQLNSDLAANNMPAVAKDIHALETSPRHKLSKPMQAQVVASLKVARSTEELAKLPANNNLGNVLHRVRLELDLNRLDAAQNDLNMAAQNKRMPKDMQKEFKVEEARLARLRQGGK